MNKTETAPVKAIRVTFTDGRTALYRADSCIINADMRLMYTYIGDNPRPIATINFAIVRDYRPTLAVYKFTENPLEREFCYDDPLN